MIEIRHRLTGELIHSVDAETLRGVDLTRVCLRSADLCRADLRKANLSQTDLSDADLRDADLDLANLRRANLRGAHVYGATLVDASLLGADLRGTALRGAVLSGTDFRDAEINHRTFGVVTIGRCSRGYPWVGVPVQERIAVFAGCRCFNSIKRARRYYWDDRYQRPDYVAEAMFNLDAIERKVAFMRSRGTM